jgi:hypothetical protein
VATLSLHVHMPERLPGFVLHPKLQQPIHVRAGHVEDNPTARVEGRHHVQPRTLPTTAGPKGGERDNQQPTRSGHEPFPPANNKLTCPTAIRFSGNDKQISSKKQNAWPVQVQRRDTSHGLDGDGPEPVANSKGIAAEAGPHVEV